MPLRAINTAANLVGEVDGSAPQAVTGAFRGITDLLRRWNGEGREPRERVVTVGELEGPLRRIGIVVGGDGSLTDSGFGPGAQTTVGAPTGLSASGAFETVLLSFTLPTKNLAHIEIWRAQSDNLSIATLRGTTPAAVFADDASPGTTYYYWIRAVSTSGAKSSFNDTAGTAATTAVRATFLINELTGQITESELYTGLNNRLNLIDTAGTGLVDRMSVAESDIVNEQNTRASADTALANDITTLYAEAGANAAAIQERASVSVDGATVAAQWDLRMQTTVDGETVFGGFGLASDGASTEMGFDVDRVWFGHPSVDYTSTSKRFPFILDSGVVYLDEAVIRQAAITNAQIASLAAEKIDAGTVNVALTLNAASILGGNLNIANKFVVDANGNTTIVSATSGARMEIANNVIKVFDSSGIKRVQLGDLTA